jgi:RpiR family carbohydrate utilization transcriptional regulator
MNFLSPAEKVVAEYVLQNPKTVVTLTTKQLALACSSSEATIIRFCKRIGINSFKDLKIEIAKEMNLEENTETLFDSPLQFEDSLETVVNKVATKSIQAITNTTKLLSLEMLEKAIEMLYASKRVFLYGAGGSSIVVQDFTQKLLRINVQAFQSNDIHVQMMMAANMNKEDVLFLVSTSGKTKEILQLISVAKEKETRTILLTQLNKSPARSSADIILDISAEEQNVRIGTMTARIAQLAVIDSLFIGLCMKKGHKIYERIIDTHQTVQRIK